MEAKATQVQKNQKTLLCKNCVLRGIGRDGRDGQNGRDGLPGSKSTCVCSCPSSGGGGSSSQAYEYALYKAPGPNWSNINLRSVPAYESGRISIVVFGLDKYYHELLSPQFVCVYENKNGDKLFSPYAWLGYAKPQSKQLTIQCDVPTVSALPLNDRTFTVAVYFRNDSDSVLFYSGKLGDDQLVFEENWKSYEFFTPNSTVAISAYGLNPLFEVTATFTWPNSTTLAVSTLPTASNQIVVNLQKYSNMFRGQNTVTMSLTTSSGTIPFAGSTGGDSVVLIGDALKPHSACSQYNLLDQQWRKASNTGFGSYCDGSGGSSKSGFKVGWNRFDDAIGGSMPTACVKNSHACGSSDGGWFNGVVPTVVGVEIDAEVCFYNQFGGCCAHHVKAKIVNCGAFHVYYLPFVPACDLAYCSKD